MYVLQHINAAAAAAAAEGAASASPSASASAAVAAAAALAVVAVAAAAAAAPNSMVGNSLAKLTFCGWGAWVRVGSMGAAGQPWPVG